MGLKFALSAGAGFYQVASTGAAVQLDTMDGECSMLHERTDGLVRAALSVDVPDYDDVAEMIGDFFEHEGHQGRELATRVQNAVDAVRAAVAAVAEGDQEGAAEIASTSHGADSPTVRFGTGGA